MDYGWLRWKDFEIVLYGTPGHARVDPLIPPALAQAMGVVLVVDGTKPDTLPRAGQLIDMIVKKKVPYVIAANRSDLPGTMAPEEIRRQLKITRRIPIFAISAKRTEDVHRVLESLVEYITQYTS
jgi:signal recognition particle receptor subunit beta